MPTVEKYHRPSVRRVEYINAPMGWMSDYRVSCNGCGWDFKGGFDTKEAALKKHALHVKKARAKRDAKNA